MKLTTLQVMGHAMHIGDTLAFDPVEWYRGAGPDVEVVVPVLSVVTLSKGEIKVKGTVGDIPNWCKIVKLWDAA